MTEDSVYPSAILTKLSAMMFDLMRIAEQIEAHAMLETGKARVAPPSRPAVTAAGNVVPFRRPDSRKRSL